MSADEVMFIWRLQGYIFCLKDLQTSVLQILAANGINEVSITESVKGHVRIRAK